MKYVHQFLVTRVSLIAIGAMLTVPLPAVAEEIHGKQEGNNVSLGPSTPVKLTGGKAASTGKANTAIGAYVLNTNTQHHGQ